MKKFSFLFFFFFSFVKLSAQSVNEIKLEDIPARYVQLVSTTKILSPFKVTTYLDYGQIGKMKDIKKGHIIGVDGKKMVFNGTMGVLNFFEKKGYKYISQNLLTVGQSNVYYYLLENMNYKNQ